VGGRNSKVKKRLRVAGIVLGSIVALLILAYLSAPRVARWYIMRNYPEVKFIASIDIHMNGSVDVWDVVIRRKGLDVELEHVYADYEKNITLERGWVTLDLDKFDAALTSLEYDGKKACWKSGVAETLFVDVALDHGCFEKNTKVVSLDKATFRLSLPWDIPRVERDQRVEIQHATITIEDRNLKARNILLYGKAEKPTLNLVNLDISLLDDSVHGSADSIIARHPWLSSGDYQLDHTNVFIPITGDAEIDTGHLGIGGVKIVVNRESESISAKGKCADWLEALPPINWWNQHAYNLTRGDLDFSIQTKPPKVKLKVDCAIKCDAEVIARLKKKFTYTAYNKAGEPFERESGPRSATWSPLRLMPEHVQKAFVTLEDPGFEWHKGVHRVALLNSLKINLKAGRFVRGGSTITMQLVKNIWLGRQKTLDRKLKEIILATMLERCLSKYEILELYLNVIEFGPKLYGIGPASRHYFSMVPANLSAEEAVYLAKLLPRPNRARRPEEGGIESARRLMGKLRETGRLPEILDVEGLDEQPELPEGPAPPAGKQPAVRSE
jgi:hypothetical protein